MVVARPPGVAVEPAAPRVLLAADRRGRAFDLAATIPVDRPRRGAVALRTGPGSWWRAEPGARGPLLLEVAAEGQGAGAAVRLGVWGPPATPAEEVESALAATAAWAGFADQPPEDFGDLVGGHPLLRRLHRHLGTPRLAALPRAFESLGRGVLGQLVQGVEGQRSMRQVAALAGEPARAAAAPSGPDRSAAVGYGRSGDREIGDGLWTWPTPDALGRTPAWALRRCGIALKGARALHAAALAPDRLEHAAQVRDWPRLDALLRALPGVGPWTSAETRLALGDADAVSVGDYNLPAVVGAALGPAGDDRRTGPGGRWTDEDMLALLAPYAGQRARVIALLMRGAVAGLHRYPPRRAPRAALSAHRYW